MNRKKKSGNRNNNANANDVVNLITATIELVIAVLILISHFTE